MVNRFLKQSRQIFTRQQSNILSAAFVIAATVFISAILGIIRNRLLIAYFRKCCLLELDAYWAAFRLPDMLFQLLVIGSLSAAFIPVFSHYLAQNRQQAYRMASSVLNIIALIFLLIALLIFIFAQPFSSLITANFTPAQIQLMANLTRLMLFAQLFFAVSNFLTGIIQAQQRFLIPALSPVTYNLSIIGSIILFSHFFGIYAPALGVVIGSFTHLLIQLPLAKKLGFSYQFSFDFRHPGVRTIAQLMLPRTLALGLSQIEITILMYLATALSAGSLTIFYLAQQLISLPVRLIGMPIGQASLPFLSQKTTADQVDQFKSTLITSLNQILYLALPASIILLVLRIPAVRIAYGARDFPWKDTLLTGKAVAIFSFSIIPESITHILTRAFYALQNTRLPFKIALLSAFISVSLAIYFGLYLAAGVIGLSLAITIASTIHTLFLGFFLYRRLGRFALPDIFLPFTKMLLATVATGLFLWLPMRFLDRYILDTTKTINLLILTLIAGTIGMAVYLFFSKIFQIKELNMFISLAKRIGNWRQVLSASEEVIEPSPPPVES